MVGFEPGTFKFLLTYLTCLNHYAIDYLYMPKFQFYMWAILPLIGKRLYLTLFDLATTS